MQHVYNYRPVATFPLLKMYTCGLSRESRSAIMLEGNSHLWTKEGALQYIFHHITGLWLALVVNSGHRNFSISSLETGVSQWSKFQSLCNCDEMKHYIKLYKINFLEIHIVADQISYCEYLQNEYKQTNIYFFWFFRVTLSSHATNVKSSSPLPRSSASIRPPTAQRRRPLSALTARKASLPSPRWGHGRHFKASFLCWRLPVYHFLLFNILQLNQHRRHECKERRCPCRDCGASFPSPSRLRSHRIAVHPQPPEQADDLNTFQCCKCHQSFQTEEELLQHQEKFAREINCDAKLQGKKRGRKPKHAAQGATGDSKRIKQEGADNHEEYSDPPTDGCSSSELQIPCPEADCDLIFPSVLALRAHKQVGHNPHACIQCDESFAQPEQLSAHKDTAHNSRYTCLTCAKSFTRESSLKAHESTHTEREEGAENT